MSPKLVLGCVIGMGSTVSGGYMAFNYFYEEEIMITDAKEILEEGNSSVCAKPIKKVTITTDESVVYYICDEITSISDDDVEVAFVTPFQKGVLSKRKNKNPANTVPVHGTYTNQDKTTLIDFYGHTVPSYTTTKDIFYIYQPSSTVNKPTQLSNSVIRTMVKDIEGLRIYPSIVITDHTTVQTIYSISCTPIKKAIIPRDQKTNYYICTDIEGEIDELNKHNVSKGIENSQRFITFFYGIKTISPITKTATQTFFLKKDPDISMTDKDIQDFIFTMTSFLKQKNFNL